MKAFLCALLILCCVCEVEAGNRSRRLRNSGHCNNDIDDIQLENALLRAQLRNGGGRRRGNGGNVTIIESRRGLFGRRVNTTVIQQ